MGEDSRRPRTSSRPTDGPGNGLVSPSHRERKPDDWNLGHRNGAHPGPPPAEGAPKKKNAAPPTPEEQRSAFVRLVVVLAAAALATVVTGTTKTVLVVVAVLTMIMLHELGHFLTAKWGGMKVTEFFVGFGPRLWSVRKGETEYGVKALPLGGYVKIIGMHNLDVIEDPADEPRTYRQKPFWPPPLRRRRRLDDALHHRLPAVLHRQRLRRRPHGVNDDRRARQDRGRAQPGAGGRHPGRRRDRRPRRAAGERVGRRPRLHQRASGAADRHDRRARRPAGRPHGDADRPQRHPHRRRADLRRVPRLPRARAQGEVPDHRRDHRRRPVRQAVGRRRLPGRRGRLARPRRQRQGPRRHPQPVGHVELLEDDHRRGAGRTRGRRRPFPVAGRVRAPRRPGGRRQPVLGDGAAHRHQPVRRPVQPAAAAPARRRPRGDRGVRSHPVEVRRTALHRRRRQAHAADVRRRAADGVPRCDRARTSTSSDR